jgi:DNA polymerase I-like protein with 3'-5' exonuclease and polymerase domains
MSEHQPFTGRPNDLPVPASIVAWDTETVGLHPDDPVDGPPVKGTVSVVSIAWLDEAGLIWGTAYPFGQGPPGEEIDCGKQAWDALLDWLARAPYGLVGHNAKFDVLHCANAAKPGYLGRNLNGYVRWDSMVAAREFWPNEAAALKQIGVRLFEADADAEQLALKNYLGPKKNPRYDLVPWEVMKPYAVQDAVLTLRTWMVQDPLLQEGHYGAHFIGSELQITAALLRMELSGIPYCRASSLQCADELRKQMGKLTQELPFDPKKAKDYYFGETTPVDLGQGEITPLGMPAYKLTDGGKPSLTADVLDKMVRQGVSYAEQLQKINRFKSAVSKWYEPFARATGADGRLRTSFRQVAAGADAAGGTRSGRFSAGRVNLQAIPKDFHVHLPVATPRQLIVRATERLVGWSLWDLDIAQAELRAAALDAGCQRMLDVIRRHGDPHGETAQQLFETGPDHPDFKFNRQIAKRANFSLIFGSGWKTFRDMIERESGVELSQHQAQEIVYGWRDLYPEFGRRIAYYEDFVRACGYVKLCNGKRRYYQTWEDAHSGFNQTALVAVD